MRDLFQILFEVCTSLNMTGVIVGGYALPAYKVFRTTVDRDFCVYAKNQERLDDFVRHLATRGIRTAQQPKMGHLLFYVFSDFGEAEIWLSPIGDLPWDEKMAKRVREFHSNYRVLSIEDFLCAKLARQDRSSTDFKDILQVIEQNVQDIDLEYLEFRLEWASLLPDFFELIQSERVKQKYEKVFPELIERSQNWNVR